MYSKKTLSLLLLILVALPSPGYCFKKRDAIMITSGVVVTGLGITFVIKSAKKSKDEFKTSQLMIQPWFPQAEFKVNGAADAFHP